MATVTIKNIPDDICKLLKIRAKAHKRSVNSEIILCLEQIVRSRKIDPHEYIEQVRQLRNSLRFIADAETIDEVKRAGRA